MVCCSLQRQDDSPVFFQRTDEIIHHWVVFLSGFIVVASNIIAFGFIVVASNIIAFISSLLARRAPQPVFFQRTDEIIHHLVVFLSGFIIVVASNNLNASRTPGHF
jgi:elongation factor P hydroxylase